MIQFKNFTAAFGEREVIKGMTCNLAENSITALIGVSGSGKTTLSFRAEKKLTESGFSVKVLDGDMIRAAYKVKLGFDRKDIKRNNTNIFLMPICC